MPWDMTSVVEHRIEVAGHATRALEVDGGGPGIVLLHGWSDSADTWRPLLAQLGARGRRAIAVDLPGFGEATRLHDGAVLPQLDAFALDLVESWANKEPVVVAGTSLGGCVALRLAEHPGNVRLAGGGPAPPRAPRQRAARRRRPGLTRRARASLLVRSDRGRSDRPQAALDPGPRAG